jgi:hypothetical protein
MQSNPHALSVQRHHKVATSPVVEELYDVGGHSGSGLHKKRYDDWTGHAAGQQTNRHDPIPSVFAGGVR